MLDLDAYEALTFDCYGTLIDWETGIATALRAALAEHHVDGDDEALLAVYARHEAAAERPPYRHYRDVLRTSAEGVAADLGVHLTGYEADTFAESVPLWPAFPDAPAALERLGRRYRLGVVTNCDDDLFAASAARLGHRFDAVVTAQQVGAYKPDHAHFDAILHALALPRERVLHVAQSLYHDHVPAKGLGFATVWVDRRHGRPGSGATPPAEAVPDLVVPDLATLADLVEGR